MKRRAQAFVENSRFENAITTLIVFNFFTLLAGTEGFDLGFVELSILFIFTSEMVLKMYGYGLSGWWRDGWNRFDAFVIVIGWLLEVDIFDLPEALGGLRALRLVRLFGRIESTRILIMAIVASARQLGGVALFSGLFLAIFTLMATMTFQKTMPEAFGDFGTSLTTLLSLAAFNNLETIGEAWEISKFGTLLVFPGYVVTVPLTALNLVIAVLSNAVQLSDDGKDTVSLEEFDKLKAEMTAVSGKLDEALALLREQAR